MSSLVWNSITICSPAADTRTGYYLSEYRPGNLSTIDITIPGVDGRFQRSTGARNTDDTSTLIVFEGLIISNNASALSSLIYQIESLGTNYLTAI